MIMNNLFLSFAVTVILAVGVFAGPRNAFVIGDVIGHAGQTVTVPFVFRGNVSEIVAFNFSIDYDARRLSHPRVMVGPDVPTGTDVNYTDFGGTVGFLELAPESFFVASGVVANITFDVAADASGTVPLTFNCRPPFNPCAASDELANHVRYFAYPGAVEIR